MNPGAITLNDIVSADWSLMLDTPGAAGSGLGTVVQGAADVNQCLQIILTTPKGSDPLRPTFGADLFQFIDYPIKAAIPALVAEITDSITRWEPRIKLLSVLVQPVIDATAQSGAHLNVTLTWQLNLKSGVPAGPHKTVVTIPARLGT
jgi:phage baseplate assembly protein W